MHTATLSPPHRRPDLRSAQSAFSVVVLYDEFFANIRAMEALDWLKHRLSPHLRLCPLCWSFESLKRHDERSTAARAAAAADLLIFSATDESRLPDHVRKWCNEIQRQQRQTVPILAALHEEDAEFSGTSGCLSSQLREIAESWRTDFMCGADFDQRLDCDFAMQLVSSKHTHAHRRAKAFGGEFQPPERHWGIND
ncbi:hypothetical protein [Prosthecobacter sp.]|uniref:hypothetical protein n=1 Tax=Prosthecobacter sp. TaxID=1965333 RepID=UPI0037847393